MIASLLFTILLHFPVITKVLKVTFEMKHSSVMWLLTFSAGAVLITLEPTVCRGKFDLYNLQSS